MIPIILASASPRRREIFDMAGLKFTVIPAKNEPDINPDIPLTEAAVEVAKAKALYVAKEHKDSAVVGADTTVFINNKVLGKPKNVTEAKEMLRLLSGRTHTVVTGVYVAAPDFSGGFSCESQVLFRNMSESEIEYYVATGEPMDKAGAYGIQGIGMRYIEKISGDFFNIMGFPMSEFYNFFLKKRINI